jgi:hypothetical protein
MLFLMKKKLEIVFDQKRWIVDKSKKGETNSRTYVAIDWTTITLRYAIQMKEGTTHISDAVHSTNVPKLVPI